MTEVGVFDQVLNFIMPLIVIGILIWILYGAFKKPIDGLIDKMREWKERRQSNGGGSSSVNIQTIQYE